MIAQMVSRRGTFTRRIIQLSPQTIATSIQMVVMRSRCMRILPSGEPRYLGVLRNASTPAWYPWRLRFVAPRCGVFFQPTTESPFGESPFGRI